MRVEVRGAEGKPANSCGDGRYDPLANQLVHELVQPTGVHPLQGRLTGAPGAVHLRPAGVSGM